MYFNGDTDKSKKKGIKIHIFLEVWCFSEYGKKDLFADWWIIFSFSFEFNHLQNIKLPAEKHESVDCKMFEWRWDIVKCGSSFYFIFDCKSAIMFVDYFELIFVHVNHLQWFFHDSLLLLKGKLAEYFFTFAPLCFLFD